MALDSEDTGISRCIIGLHGLGGYLIAVVGLLVTLGVLMYMSLVVQSENSETYYSIDQDIHKIKAQSIHNNSYRIIEKKGE
jgi:uncharacterized membrane protein YhiD involved in acid resistance